MAYDFAHGSGTANDPYLIATEADFWGMFDVSSGGQPNFISKHFRQSADIQITQSVSQSRLTRCVYDGDNRIISGLKKGAANLKSSTWKNSIFSNCTNENPSWYYPALFLWTWVDDDDEENLGPESELHDIQLLDSPGIYIFAGEDTIATNLTVKNSGGFVGGTLVDSEVSNCYGENLSHTQDYYATGALCDVFGCEFENIVVVNVEYEDTDCAAGGMVGETYYSNFKNCVVLGAKITGDEASGGFAGAIYGGTFEDCYALGVEVTLDPSYGRVAGGFVGEVYDLQLWREGTWHPFVFTRCIAHGEIDADAADGAGGFAGYADNTNALDVGSIFSQCGAEVSVSNSSEYSGGFVGSAYGPWPWIASEYLPDIMFEDCYALGDSVLSDSENAISNGGFCGIAEDVTFERCFSKGAVSGGVNVGGFCGEDAGYYYSEEEEVEYRYVEGIDCYFDHDVAPLDDDYATPKTTAEMKTQSTFSGWGFTNIWKLGAFDQEEHWTRTDTSGEYSFIAPIGKSGVEVMLVLDPSDGYPFLRFETKKTLTEVTEPCNFYVRGRMPE